MKILLYNPDNGVTRNFMPHLWMFLLQALTPPGHEVILIDGNARAMTEEELVRFVRAEGIVDWRHYDNDGPDGMPNSGDDDGDSQKGQRRKESRISEHRFLPLRAL